MQDKVNLVETCYWFRDRVRFYETKSETPMHASLRERYPARTRLLHVDPTVDFFGPLTIIVSEIKSSSWDTKSKEMRDRLKASKGGG